MSEAEYINILSWNIVIYGSIIKKESPWLGFILRIIGTIGMLIYITDYFVN